MNAGVFLLGVILLILGLFTYGYVTDEGFSFSPPGDEPDRPYLGIGLILLIFGFILMIAGAFMPRIVKETRSVEHPVSSRRKVVVESD